MSNNSDDLAPLYLAWSRDVLRLLGQWPELQSLKSFQFQFRKFYDNGSYDDAPVVRRTWWSLFEPHIYDVISLPSFDPCAKTHYDSGIHPKSATARFNPLFLEEVEDPQTGRGDYERHRRLFAANLLSPLIEAIERSNSIEPPDAVVLDSHSSFVSLHSRETVDVVHVIPLYNIRVDHSFELSREMRVIPFNGEMKTAIWNDQQVAESRFSHIRSADFHVLKWCIALESKRSIGEPAGFAFAEKVKRAITALRLINAGDIGATGVFEITNGRALAAQSLDASSRTLPFEITEYALRESNVPEIAQVLYLLEKADEKGDKHSIVLALRRFNAAYQRREIEDRLIDEAIVLEATLLPTERDELSYRLALRGAALLRNHFKPSETFRLLKALYDTRSEFVHNGTRADQSKTLSKIKLSPKEFEAQIISLVRRILREVLSGLEESTSLKALAESLDGKIVDSLSTPC
ncbi:MAG: hypothetical protein IPK53_01470 [bacterium]|nr:hypothetical protein [bacterium]